MPKRKRVRTRSVASRAHTQIPGACADGHTLHRGWERRRLARPSRPGLAERGAGRSPCARPPVRPPVLTLTRTSCSRGSSPVGHGGYRTPAIALGHRQALLGLERPDRGVMASPGRLYPPRVAYSQWMSPLALNHPPPIPPTQSRVGVVSKLRAGRGRWPHGDKRRRLSYTALAVKCKL